MITRMVLVMALVFVGRGALADDIGGLWKHSDEPGWIEIDLARGKGTVVRNDKFPERVGPEILKDLKADDSAENFWHGEVYAERLGEYKGASISLAAPDRMEFKVKVGFMTRIIEWVRAEALP
ncbi:MAG: hypothetical protein AAGI11_15520 [Pseudomonadota bacterium]